MRVNIGTIEVGDDARRELRKRSGKSGLATRDEVRAYAEALLAGALHDLARGPLIGEAPATQAARVRRAPRTFQQTVVQKHGCPLCGSDVRELEDHGFSFRYARFQCGHAVRLAEPVVLEGGAQ